MRLNSEALCCFCFSARWAIYGVQFSANIVCIHLAKPCKVKTQIQIQLSQLHHHIRNRLSARGFGNTKLFGASITLAGRAASAPNKTPSLNTTYLYVHDLTVIQSSKNPVRSSRSLSNWISCAFSHSTSGEQSTTSNSHYSDCFLWQAALDTNQKNGSRAYSATGCGSSGA